MLRVDPTQSLDFKTGDRSQKSGVRIKTHLFSILTSDSCLLTPVFKNMRASINAYVPQCAPRRASLRRALVVWCSVTVGALIFLSLIVLAPLVLAHGYAVASRIIYQAFSLVCHQMPERSWYLIGYPLAVCARCSGLYTGFAAGALLYPVVRSLVRRDTPARLWLIVAVLPVTVDFTLGYLRIWENTHLSRSVTGALFGAVTAFYVIPGLVDFSYTSWRQFFTRDSQNEQRVSTLRNV